MVTAQHGASGWRQRRGVCGSRRARRRNIVTVLECLRVDDQISDHLRVAVSLKSTVASTATGLCRRDVCGESASDSLPTVLCIILRYMWASSRRSSRRSSVLELGLHTKRRHHRHSLQPTASRLKSSAARCLYGSALVVFIRIRKTTCATRQRNKGGLQSLNFVPCQHALL